MTNRLKPQELFEDHQIFFNLLQNRPNKYSSLEHNIENNISDKFPKDLVVRNNELHTSDGTMIAAAHCLADESQVVHVNTNGIYDDDDGIFLSTNVLSILEFSDEYCMVSKFAIGRTMSTHKGMQAYYEQATGHVNKSTNELKIFQHVQTLFGNGVFSEWCRERNIHCPSQLSTEDKIAFELENK